MRKTNVGEIHAADHLLDRIKDGPPLRCVGFIRLQGRDPTPGGHRAAGGGSWEMIVRRLSTNSSGGRIPRSADINVLDKDIDVGGSWNPVEDGGCS